MVAKLAVREPCKLLIPPSPLPLPAIDLVPEWPLQAMPHVPIYIVKAVMNSLMELNATHEAAISGRYSTWDPPLSYAPLRSVKYQLADVQCDCFELSETHVARYAAMPKLQNVYNILCDNILCDIATARVCVD